MDSLAIFCTTCGCKLHISNPELIGQIVACPKCGAMVQVTRSELISPNDSALDSGNDQELQPESTKDDYDLSPDDENASIPSRSLESEAEASWDQEENLQDLPPESDAPYRSIPGQWQGDRTQRTRQITLLTFVLAGGLAAAIVLFYGFVRYWQQNRTPLAEGPIHTTKPIEQSTESTDLTPTNSTHANDSTPPLPSPTLTDDSVLSPEPSPTKLREKQSETGSETQTENLSVESNNIPEVTNSPDPTDDQAALSFRSDIDEESHPENVTPETNPKPDLDASKSLEPKSELPEELQKIADSLFGFDDGPQDLGPEREASPIIELEGPAVETESAVKPSAPIDIDQSMQFEVAFNKHPRPLILWVQVLSQLTGVPISLDIASLDAGNIDPEIEVLPEPGWNTANKVLHAMAKSVGCEVQQTDQQIIIAASANAIETGIQPALQVDDLIDPKSTPTQQDTWIQSFKQIAGLESIRLDPQSWELKSDRSKSDWIAALVADGLRLGRKLPTRIPRTRTQRWLAIENQLEWPVVTGGKNVDAIDQPQPIVELVRRIASANQVAVAIVWPDAWRHGLTPKSIAMPWLPGVPAGNTLTNILSPYGLETRQMGTNLWWIGSRATYDRDVAIAVIPIPKGTRKTVMERIAKSIGVTNIAKLPVLFDPESNHMVAQMPRFMLRQLPILVTGQR